MDASFYGERADLVRRLADLADPFTKKRLLELARKYDGKAAKPDATSRLLPLPQVQGSAASGEAKR